MFHCVLVDGSMATMVYERSHNIYGWCRMTMQSQIKDLCTGPVQGTDYVNLINQTIVNKLNFDTQGLAGSEKFMDSWVSRVPIQLTDDEYYVTGLEHLEGYEVQVLVDGAVHPDRTVSGGQISLQVGGTEAVVGLKYNKLLTTLPFDQGAPSGGSGSGWMKRWNKIFIRVVSSRLPRINGERSPERHPSTLMDTPQGEVNQEILKVNLGHSRHAQVTIDQDLPYGITVLGIFGELGQSIT